VHECKIILPPDKAYVFSNCLNPPNLFSYLNIVTERTSE